jgi:hypothetical protein
LKEKFKVAFPKLKFWETLFKVAVPKSDILELPYFDFLLFCLVKQESGNFNHNGPIKHYFPPCSD